MTFRVEIIFKNGKTETFEKVTEIHYGHNQLGPIQVAFESDVLGYGFNYNIHDIIEFEVLEEKVSLWRRFLNWRRKR